jgi:ABC-type branched-subunit amino acid transport system substrate-binding protein
MLSGKWIKAARNAGALALLASIGGLGTSCSLLIDKNADQCEADSDCTKFAGTSCKENVCIAASCQVIGDCSKFPDTICKGGSCVPSSEGCSTNKECASQGSNTICRKDAGICVPLQSSLCATVLGDWQDDNAVIFGAILPLTGDDTKTGYALRDSVELALNDFSRVNDLPPAPGQTHQRPIVFVACDDASDSATAEKSAHHLIDDIGVQAILGAAFSGITIDVATDVTIPAGVLLFSPSATSTVITTLNDHGLVWRTSPSDVYQAAALKQYVRQLETKVRKDNSLPATAKIKLAVVYKGDAYGNGLAKALTSGTGGVLQINGLDVTSDGNSGNYKAYDYGDPDDPKSDPVNESATVTNTINFEPDIILVFGTTEGVTNLFEPIENGWIGAQRPLWVFSDGGEVPTLTSTINKIGGSTSLRARVTGTVPGTNNSLFQTFRNAYNFTDGSSADTFGTAGSYDITYLLSYSVVALGAEPLTGANFNKALGKFFESGQMVNAGDDPTVAFQQLQAGKPINFEGASGSLNFNPSTGEAPSDIQIWCVTEDGGGNANGERNSGEYYRADKDTLVGSFGSICD